MARLGRNVGLIGFVLSVGVACTQLFGDQQNTLAPPGPPRLPTAFPGLQPEPGTPGAALCTPGEMRCDGAQLQTCTDDLTGWVTTQRCAAAALCQSNPAACLAATCNDDEMVCSGALLQKCNADRNGWDLFATCLSPAHCNADQRQCLNEPCVAGQRRCDRSDADQSPSLEVCRDDRLDWGPLDSCATRELCDQTLTVELPGGGLILGTDGVPQVQAPVTPETVLKCNLPICQVGEVRCSGAQLEFCSEGRTEWTVAEECGSAALCLGSMTNLGPAGTPQCLPPSCALNQHQCAEGGVLSVCNEDRTGFRTIQACIGPPFCNAALADQGEDGCRDAPCAPGEMQCNGAKIQVCNQDRTALDDTGTVCESPALCNADDPTKVFCEEPVCRRGATSGSEFACKGAELQRCNESLTGYDTTQTCVTPELCDASRRSEGCVAPACQRGAHACSPQGFLQTCNAGQTGFEDTENCGSPAQCDANAGRCSDPCEPGSVRCNAQSGDLEECRDLLTGWQTIADCVSLPLCDANNRRCNQPVCAAGARRCETRNGNPVISECAPGREGFVVTRTCGAGQICDAQNNECDVCAPNSTSCDGDTLVRCDGRGQTQNRQNPPCGPGLCSAAKGRCLVCNPINSARCTGLQLRVCSEGDGGNEFERSEDCDTNELCAQTLNDCGRGLNGQNCQCKDGACAPNQLRCQDGSIQRCNAGRTGFENIQSCQFGCNAGSTTCNECAGTTGTCNGTQFRACNNGRLGAVVNCGDNNPCTNVACNPQSGCQFPPVNNNTSCSDGNVCNGSETCQNGSCIRTGAAVTCNDGNPCTVDSNNNCNPQTGQCSFPPVNNGTQCPDGNLCDGTETCNNGRCGDSGNPVSCQEDNNPCTTVSCDPANGRCTPRNVNNGTQCPDSNLCDGTETCNNGTCGDSGNNRVNCTEDNNPCTTVSCNPSNGACGFSNNNGTCPGGRCEGGQCRPTCTSGSCNGTQFTACNNGTPAAPINCPDDGNNNPCRSPSCSAAGCGLQNVGGNCTVNNVAGTCQNGTCQPNQVCTPNSATCLSLTARSVCNGQGSGTSIQSCTADRPFCVGNGNCVECRNSNTLDCNDDNVCTTDTCNAQNSCNNAPIAGCTTCNFAGPRCQPGGTTVATCSNGVITSSTNCGALGCVVNNAACSNCPVGSAPVCASNAVVRNCVNGRQQDVPCPGGQSCVGGRCIGLPGVVAPAASCPGATFVSCNGTTLTCRGELVFQCPPGTACNGQVCR